eukprot:CAMPEP_0172360650 /NCGR_PEP_ID=MMETSP1060-20121228/4635_1 /TAXON_ID=37318 /ORGANISM="Pseudo-nitzschia pungens, Strain cf. cingulata" /LENGTH=165 /DNA_ID=CAMNT_0013082691 /DNA_START=537 /DNA_END=1030 /DNA_ORIENTATION=+
MAFFAAAIAPAAPKDRPVRQQFVRAGIASGSRQHIQTPGRQQQVHVTVILVVVMVMVVVVIGIEFHSVLKHQLLFSFLFSLLFSSLLFLSLFFIACWFETHHGRRQEGQSRHHVSRKTHRVDVGLEASVLAEVNGVAGQPREGKRGIALTTTTPTTTPTTIRESV